MITIENKALIYLSMTMSETDHMRIMLMSGGCAGFRFNFALENEYNTLPDDVILSDNPKVVIDEYSMSLMPNAEIYLDQTPFGSQISARDPNASTCGCGISFNPATI